jgi:LmbE family N-acetylglucosaminyl deacetylase
MDFKVILFCAHPDDAEICAGGTIHKFIKKGYKVKIIVMTNGNIGNNDISVIETQSIRKKEMISAADYLGCEVESLDINDGEVLASIENRIKIVNEIRKYKPNLVITHRNNDYHPDHRYTSILIQDSLVLICCKNFSPIYEPLDYTPITLFFWDRFTKPNKFHADIIINITDEICNKISTLSIHKSQFCSESICAKFLTDINRQIKADVKTNFEFVEVFEICEYAKLEELEYFMKCKKEIFS